MIIATLIIVALGTGVTLGYMLCGRLTNQTMNDLYTTVADAHRLRDGALADRERLVRLEALAQGRLYQADKVRRELLDELSKAQARIVLFENGINHSTETEAAS